MNIKNLFQSKTFKIILCAIGLIIAVLLIFQAGIFVGYRKAGFSFRWAENYHRNFGGPRMGSMMEFPGKEKDFPSAHGAAGKIIKIDLPTIAIAGPDNIEKSVLIKDDTVITRLRDNIKPADLKVDDFVVVIGSPNDKAQVEAKFIRILPSPPAK